MVITAWHMTLVSNNIYVLECLAFVWYHILKKYSPHYGASS